MQVVLMRIYISNFYNNGSLFWYSISSLSILIVNVYNYDDQYFFHSSTCFNNFQYFSYASNISWLHHERVYHVSKAHTLLFSILPFMLTFYKRLNVLLDFIWFSCFYHVHVDGYIFQQFTDLFRDMQWIS